MEQTCKNCLALGTGSPGFAFWDFEETHPTVNERLETGIEMQGQELKTAFPDFSSWADPVPSRHRKRRIIYTTVKK